MKESIWAGLLCLSLVGVEESYSQVKLVFFGLLFLQCFQGYADLDYFINPGASLTNADYSFVGEEPRDVSGYGVASAGDVDGDGLADLLIGAGGNDDGDDNAGKTYLFLGASLLRFGASSLDLANADYTFKGDHYNVNSGEAVASAGDVDGDGLDDLLIGEPYSNEGGTYSGKAYLLLAVDVLASSTTDIILSAARYAFIGESATDYAGSCVASAGDVDGDGFADLLIGAPYNDNGGTAAGKTYLLLGSDVLASSAGAIDLSLASYTFIGEAPGDYSGESMASAGDVDGDGLSDLLIGAGGNDDGGTAAGKTYLLLGSSISASGTTDINLSNADYSFIGENNVDYSGDSVASAGDVDGDGLSDLLIGALNNSDSKVDAGKTYLLLASDILASASASMDLSMASYAFLGEAAEDYSGESVASAGDVDGDGLSDILIGASWSNGSKVDAGKTYLLLASDILVSSATDIKLSAANYIFIGENAKDYSGLPVASAGDVNGDGSDDLLIAASENDDGGIDAGKTYLVFGICPITDTIYVDSILGSDSNRGCEKAPVATMAKGLELAEASSLTNVIVLGGTYSEVVTLSSNICLQGQLRDVSGTLTPPILSDPGNSPYLVYGADNASLKYFMLKGGGICLSNEHIGMTIEENRVECYADDQEAIWVGHDHNNIKNNVLLSRSTNNAQPVVRLSGFAQNNTFVNNTMHRYSPVKNDALIVVKFEKSSASDSTFLNNILYASVAKTFIKNGYTNWCSFYSESSGLSNDIRNNWTSPYNYQISVSDAVRWQNIKRWRDPGFNAEWPNVRAGYELAIGSGCIDMGSILSAYNDPDGSRNDMGVYGGPNSIDFLP